MLKEGTVAPEFEVTLDNGEAFRLSDERGKATRKVFRMEVKSFNTDTGLLTIQANKPKREQDSGGKGKQRR